MKYVPPVGGLANDPYVDANPVGGIEGSPVPAAAIENPMREIEALIVDAGLVPSNANLAQLVAATRTLIQKQSPVISAAGGTANALTAAYTPAIAALTNGMTLFVRPTAANSTTTPTFTPASGVVAAKTIVKGNGQALLVGDIAGAGHWLHLQYDWALDGWVLLNPATGVLAATATNDVTFSDNSGKPASSSWVRGAMAAIATAAGFVMSAAGNGYIKFPTWLGSWVVQWGQNTVGWGTIGSIPLNITFPTACYVGLASVANVAAGYACSVGVLSQTSMGIFHNAGTNQTINWIALGK